VTETSPEIWTAIIPLAGVALGGLIGWGGSVVTHWLSQRAADRQHRRVKLEELVGLAYSLRGWLDRAQNHYLLSKELPEGPIPVDRMEALCHLYFADLREPMLAVVLPAFDILNADIEFGTKQLKHRDSSTDPALSFQGYRDHRVELLGRLLTALDAFVSEAANVMRRI
jgi:hypothetical protein